MLVGVVVTVEVVMFMGMDMIVAMGMGVLVGMGMTVVGMLMGVSMGVVMMMVIMLVIVVVIVMHRDSPLRFFFIISASGVLVNENRGTRLRSPVGDYLVSSV